MCEEGARHNKGLLIVSEDQGQVHLSPSDALMLLDILRNEEQKIRQLADDTRPIPIKIQV